MIRVGIAGTGGWGINLVRAFARLNDAQVAAVCDPQEAALTRAAAIVPGARRLHALDEMLELADLDAVVLATPAVAHAAHARQALAAGKHVFVEKPLALRADDAEEVVRAAERAKRTLMVGHIMLYHPVVQRLKSMLQAGELGQVLYLYATRVNLGKLRRDENALWSLGPHDVSMILYLLGDLPQSVNARGGAYLQDRVHDVVFVNMAFGSGVMAQVQLSWLDPRKERRLTVVGSKKMVEFDDVHPVEKLRIYDKGFDRPPGFSDFSEFLSIRNGDISIPQVALAEPLDLECRHFLECVAKQRQPITDGGSALNVVRVLEAAQRSLDEQCPTSLARPSADRS
jgi:predicted dehydrogenase